ncbi:MAG: YihA family ribosome biogenesis GTP-binding protein [Clostridia bacterium]|nr:YihA family ribosome biogenesis GTP-binding protein [Clostridia bacterium]
MVIKNAEFITSAGTVEQIIKGSTPEIAVVGRSNVGKSSFINFMCNHGRLAKTSKEPGRTRLINYFDVNKGEFIFVDLPGYGFAKVNDNEKAKWGKIIEAYLQESTGLRNVFVLLDIRRDPSADDVQMLNYLYHYNIPFTIIATKGDKLSRSAGLKRKREIANALKVGIGNVLLTSSLNKSGAQEVLDRIENILEVSELPIDDEE